MVKFLRRDWSVLPKLGKKRKNKQKWRNPSGRHNKMRENIRGKPAKVSIGYGTKDEKEKIIRVENLDDVKNVKKGEKIIISKIGAKKKMEIVKMANEKGIEIVNVNTKKFLKNKEDKK
jgi:ribosomal protein L32E